MTRAEFESFIARLVWRTGDTVFEADIEYLIRAGQARLNRDLLVQRRLSTFVTTPPTINARIPADDIVDFYAVNRIDDGECVYQYATPQELRTRVLASDWGPYYTIEGDDILLASEPSATAVYTVGYHTKLPPYDNAETWVQVEHFDLFMHAVLMHAAPYVREDERLPIWQGNYIAELESALAADKQRRYGGSPLRNRMPGVVA